MKSAHLLVALILLPATIARADERIIASIGEGDTITETRYARVGFPIEVLPPGKRWETLAPVHSQEADPIVGLRQLRNRLWVNLRADSIRLDLLTMRFHVRIP